MRAAAIIAVAAALGGCAHKDVTAPCEPVAAAYAATSPAPAPFDGVAFDSGDGCGDAKPVNVWRAPAAAATND